MLLGPTGLFRVIVKSINNFREDVSMLSVLSGWAVKTVNRKETLNKKKIKERCYYRI